MSNPKQIGLGGGCHWCTEAVFQHVPGVIKVRQGYIASVDENTSLSEAVLVTYNSSQVSLKDLIDIHLATHSSSKEHSMRDRYRSAIYYLDEDTRIEAQEILDTLTLKYDKTFITQVLKYYKFKESRESIRNYYKKNTEAPFCQRYITPKLDIVSKKLLI